MVAGKFISVRIRRNPFLSFRSRLFSTDVNKNAPSTRPVGEAKGRLPARAFVIFIIAKCYDKRNREK